MKPGQVLHIVNNLYPYTVQFAEESWKAVTGVEEKIQTNKLPCEDSCDNDDVELVPRKTMKMEVMDTQGSSVHPKISKTSVSPLEGTSSKKASVLVFVLVLFLRRSLLHQGCGLLWVLLIGEREYRSSE